MAFSPTGDRLTIVSTIGVYTYQNETLREAWRWTDEVREDEPIALSPDGSKVALVFYSDPDPEIWLWDVQTREGVSLTDQLGKKKADALAFSPDGSTLLIKFDYGELIFWDLVRGEQVREVEYLIAYEPDMIISPDGRYVSIAMNNISLFDLSSEEVENVDIVTGCGGFDLDQAFSPDNQILALTCGILDQDRGAMGFLSLIDLQNQWHFFTWETTLIYSLAFSPDGIFFARGNYNGTIDLRGEVGQYIIRIQGHADELYPPGITSHAEFIEYDNAVTGLAFSPDSSTLASGSEDGSVILIHLAPPAEPDPNDTACALQFSQEVHASPDSRLWIQPDVDDAVSVPVLPDRGLYVLLGPKWAPILKGTETSGWFWKVSYAAIGPSAGWIWEGRLEECQ
jgi:WD40 repeat protein